MVSLDGVMDAIPEIDRSFCTLLGRGRGCRRSAGGWVPKQRNPSAHDN